MTRSIGLLGRLLGAGVFFGVACTGDLGMMTTTESDTTDSQCPIGSLNCPCTSGFSCDSGLLCAQKTCVEQDPGNTTTGEVTTTEDPTTQGSETTTGVTECDGDGAGAIDPACPSGQPYCVQGDCLDCGQLECGQLSPSLPLCDPDTGRCAACLCDESAPVCDPVAHLCSVCTTHSDCPDGACDMWSGACIPASATLWVDGSAGGCNDGGDGTKTAPLCTLATAFQRIGAAPAGSHAVRVRPGDYNVNTPLRATADHLVALVHATGGADDPEVKIFAAAAPAIAIDSNGALIIDRVRVQDGGNDGLSCMQGKAWLDRLTIAGTAARGMATEGCEVRLRRSVLFDNAFTGAEISGGELRVENTFITGNGNTQSGGGGIYLAGGATLDAVYTTWIENYGQAGTPFSVACDDDPGSESVAVRNSVALNKGFNTLCDGSQVEDTAWSTDTAQGNNLAVPFTDLAMYLISDGKLAGVYRAVPGTALDQLARWKAGDPAIDFDGDDRPTGDSEPDFAGADRVVR